MLQLPQPNVKSTCFSRADLIDIGIGIGGKVRKKEKPDPIIERIAEFNATLSAYHEARARVEEIVAKHSKHARLFDWPAVYLQGQDLLVIARNVNERRFTTVGQIDRWGEERTAFFTKKATNKHYVDRVAFLVPKLKSALRKAEREHRAFQKRTGYFVANQQVNEALERLSRADKGLDRISPRTPAGAVTAIKFATEQLLARKTEHVWGLYGIGDCARLLERTSAIISRQVTDVRSSSAH